MRRRWSRILPIYGLLLFSLVTLESIQLNKLTSRHSATFYWSVVRPDSDPLRQKGRAHPCDTNSDCGEFEIQTAWVSPGLLDKALIYPALPAFLLEAALLAGLARLGVNQLVAFLVSMPLLITVWFYFLGWILDRWIYKRALVKKVSAAV